MKLFEPTSLGALQLSNRIVMAPLTRTRAGEHGIPGPLHVDHDLVDGVTIDTDFGPWTAVETPGHAPSHVCLHNPEHRILIGDVEQGSSEGHDGVAAAALRQRRSELPGRAGDHHPHRRSRLRAGPAIAAFFSNLTPLFAALMSSAFLGEAPHLYHGMAFLLIVGGIVVSSRRSA